MHCLVSSKRVSDWTTLTNPLFAGKVKITAPHSTRFDEIRITLEGAVETWVENLSPSTTRSRTTAVHNFLRLNMPIRESDYPQPRVIEGGNTHSFSFNFVIPEQLLPRSCTHECVGDHVHHAHLQLPPYVSLLHILFFPCIRATRSFLFSTSTMLTPNSVAWVMPRK